MNDSADLNRYSTGVGSEPYSEGDDSDQVWQKLLVCVYKHDYHKSGNKRALERIYFPWQIY